jgi:branched-chain amino acid transport system ATP-binding protein
MNAPDRDVATVLTVEDLHVDYGHIRAVQGASLSVSLGITALLGSNGAGKSSLVKAIAGLERPTSGTVRLADGRDITRATPHRRVLDLGIVLVPEGRGTLPRMTVLENLAFGLRIGEQRARSKTRLDRAMVTKNDVLALFPQLERRLKVQARYLSGGEQQMLSIARALAMDPDILLVDEPSLGLSPAVVKTLFSSISKVVAERRIAMVLIEQDTTAALSLSDYVYVMERGCIELAGPSDSIAEDPRLRTAYLGGAVPSRETP